MLKYVWEYRFIIAVIIAVVFYAISDWNSFKAKSYAVMLQAKSLAKDGVLKSGKEQADWVADKLYGVLPARWKVFLTQDRLRKVIEYLYSKGKDLLDDGKINNSIQ